MVILWLLKGLVLTRRNGWIISSMRLILLVEFITKMMREERILTRRSHSANASIVIQVCILNSSFFYYFRFTRIFYWFGTIQLLKFVVVIGVEIEGMLQAWSRDDAIDDEGWRSCVEYCREVVYSWLLGWDGFRFEWNWELVADCNLS